MHVLYKRRIKTSCSTKRTKKEIEIKTSVFRSINSIIHIISKSNQHIVNFIKSYLYQKTT